MEQVWMLFPGFTLLNEPDSGVLFICHEVNSGNIISDGAEVGETRTKKLAME
uniref:Uncharacterized protein n=1 Tax=Amphimedon queenslandica TaxID=400682 RepID=A0A1X7VFX9_AMPQE